MTMLSEPEIGVDLMRALREAQQGDQSAWETLFNECYPKVQRVVSRKLNSSHSFMRSLYDSTDFASDVMKSLAANFNQLNFTSIEKLFAFLIQVAEQKVIDESRRRRTKKRDVTREQRLYSGDMATGPVQLPSGGPTPSQVAQGNEFQEQLLARQTQTGRKIIELRGQGYSNADIAEMTGWNIRKVQRFLQNLHDSLDSPGG